MIYPISVDKLYCFIYHNDVNHKSALENGNFKIIPLSQSPIVKFLEGDTEIYSMQSELFIKRPDSIGYNLAMYELGKMNDSILAVKFEDKFILCDGMHRSSILYYKGHIDINVTITNVMENPTFANFEPYIKSDKFFHIL